MFSQPLQELYDNSFVIIVSILVPMVIDSAKKYRHERNLRIKLEQQVELCPCKKKGKGKGKGQRAD